MHSPNPKRHRPGFGGARLAALLGLWLGLAVITSCTPAQRTTSTPEQTSAPPPTSQQGDATDEAREPRPLPESVTAGVAVGHHGAVASAEDHASRVGLSVLQRGGNAIDAAVAVGFALAVTHPSAGNVGGGGFMVVRMADGTATTIDYRETAPAAATPDMYLDERGNVGPESVLGAKAAGIPGTVAGLALAHSKLGTLPWRELVEPAVVLARDGHAIDSFHAEDMERAVQRMREAGLESSAKHYLAQDGSPLQPGDRFVQADLAGTLQQIAEQGPRVFYEGALAERMASAVQAAGGLWTAEDLASYRAIERKPIRFEYLGHEIISMPPPSAGGVVLRQILAASELLDIRQHPARSPAALHLYIEATRRAYADRNYLLGDPDFAKVETDRLTSREYIEARMADIDSSKATPSDKVSAGEPRPGSESRETTHYSVADRFGNAVSNTYTLNTSFGAKLVIEGTGVLLNNEMDDFAAKPGSPNSYGLVQGEQNRIEPGKRMLSSMTPTIVAKEDKLRAVVGTPGGSTITTTVAQIVRAIVDHGAPLDEAVNAPRVHHQWMPDMVIVEPGTDAQVVEGLKAFGHNVVESRWGRIGHANCIEVDPETGAYRAVADVTRDGGSAVAY